MRGFDSLAILRRCPPAVALAALWLCAQAPLASRAQAPIAPAAADNLRRDTLPAGAPLVAPAGVTILPTTVRAAPLDSAARAGGVADGDAPGDTAAYVVYTYRVLDTAVFAPRFRVDSARLLNRRVLDPNSTDGGSGGALAGGIGVRDLRRELGAVDYRGTFGRGLRFGNSQDLVLDSKLDLQLNGDLGDGLRVAAVVSDQNIPIQPEGNTVQLREFDRVFVTLDKGPHGLTAGDYSLRTDRGHFLKFDKNLQGLSYAYAAERAEGRASLAAARGQFRRIQLPVADGNQGPYRLTGSRGESFVVVLAGTERVYLDGRLLERGLDRDYVIDYNRGEVTFTARRLVNRFQRVLVEYEYVDREYLRTLITAEAGARVGRWRLYGQGLQQQDGLRRTGPPLSEAAEARLRTVGGARAGTLVPSGTVLPEGSSNPLRYRLDVDPDRACGAPDSVWVFAPEASPDAEELFAVGFVDVGVGNGDYVLAAAALASGSAYEFSPRDAACAPTGRFAPLQRVQTPRSLRLASLGGALVADTAARLEWEATVSRSDLNRFSDAAVTAFAGYAAAEKSWRVGEGGRLTAGAGVERTGDGFEAIAPWRDAEFKRAWNLGDLATVATAAPGSELLGGASLGYATARSALGYGLRHYRQAGRFSGFRQNWTAAHRVGAWALEHSGDVLAATRRDPDGPGEADGDDTGRRELTGAARYADSARTLALEVRELRTENYDALLDRPAEVGRVIREWGATWANVAADSTWRRELAYRGRDDRGDGPGARGVSHQIDVALSSPERRRQRLSVVASYRRAAPNRADGVAPPGDGGAAEREDYYLGRVVHDARVGERSWLRAQTTAEAGSGQERRIAVQFLRVQPGLGQYVWRDYDGDGVEDLGEFEIARFADSASYVRTVLLTDDFVATNSLAVNQSLTLDLGRLGGAGPARAGAWWRRLSFLNTANLKRRALQGAGYGRLLAVSIGEGDTTVVGDDLSWRAAGYLNRARNAFRAELEHRQVANRAISLQGLQVLRTTGQRVRVLQPLGEAWRVAADLDRERRRSASEGLAERNFVLDSRSAAPSVSWQPGAVARAELTARYREGESRGAAERVIARSLVADVELRLSEARTPTAGSPSGGARGARKPRRRPFAGATVTAKLERVDQRYRGEPDSPAGFALLDGLRPGRSWIWALSLDQQIGRALQLSLRYDGRRTGGGDPIHAGQAQLQAIF